MNPDLVARAKLRIDVRKWAAARFNFKEFGDKPEAPVGGGGNTLNQTTININTVPVGSRILEDGTIIEGEVVPADKKEINNGWCCMPPYLRAERRPPNANQQYASPRGMLLRRWGRRRTGYCR